MPGAPLGGQPDARSPANGASVIPVSGSPRTASHAPRRSMCCKQPCVRLDGRFAASGCSPTPMVGWPRTAPPPIVDDRLAASGCSVVMAPGPPRTACPPPGARHPASRASSPFGVRSAANSVRPPRRSAYRERLLDHRLASGSPRTALRLPGVRRPVSGTPSAWRSFPGFLGFVRLGIRLPARRSSSAAGVRLAANGSAFTWRSARWETAPRAREASDSPLPAPRRPRRPSRCCQLLDHRTNTLRRLCPLVKRVVHGVFTIGPWATTPPPDRAARSGGGGGGRGSGRGRCRTGRGCRRGSRGP